MSSTDPVWAPPSSPQPNAPWGPPGGPQPNPVAATNSKAIVALVLGICGLTAIPVVGAILALVFGYTARGEIDRSHGTQGGRGLAVAGIVLGWIGIVLAILFVGLFVLLAVGGQALIAPDEATLLRR